MCGIAGIFGFSGQHVNLVAVARMTTAMASRGPDGEGHWQSDDGRLSLGHRRLSIIDLNRRSDQPLHSQDGRYSIVFNGEIYNYRELRRNLEAKGSIFRTESDTEVILELFRVRGKSMFCELRGMFAFTIWDSLERRLFLVRDPYGIKPLYYFLSTKYIQFASQVKALVAGGVAGSPDPAAIVGFHLFGSIPEPYTYLDTVKSLPSGHYLEISDRGSAKIESYSLISEIINLRDYKESLYLEHHKPVREALLDSVKAHLVSDLPVGLFLSAGIDSGALLGLMRDATASQISCLTLAFDEFQSSRDDEATIAAQVARQYGADHHVHCMTRDDFLADLPLFFAAMDQPTIDGVNTYFISKAAKEIGLKIAISGLGGDELFGGYPSFRHIPRDVARVKLLRMGCDATASDWQSLPRSGRSGHIEPKIEALFRYGASFEGAYLARRCVFTPQELPGVMDRDLAIAGLTKLQPLEHIGAQTRQKSRSSFGHVALLESTIYMRNQLLRDTDWAAMAHSLEVRTPLVDSFLLRKLSPHFQSDANRIDKSTLATAPETPLPDSVTRRPKSGFSTPLHQWLQHENALGGWRDSPTLRRKGTKWAKRWAFSVSQQFFGAI
ncbi:asparagine synthase (glutamine-hydrolyzing) [Novosphingobium sp. MW5]|nr:asparagine synthase (glutamine-hydrolyzing) [Novosphingobium sp. MW5]